MQLKQDQGRQFELLITSTDSYFKNEKYTKINMEIKSEMEGKYFKRELTFNAIKIGHYRHISCF
jgi:hypothetical protein